MIRAVRGLEPADDPGDAEIRQLRLAVLGEQDVRRLDVTMQGAAPVRGLQRASHLHPDVQSIAPVDRTGVVDLGLQRPVRVVLHDDVGPTGGGGADLEDVDDVGMSRQLSHRHLLAHEPLHIVRLEISRQHLYRDRAVQRALGAAVHHPEPAPPDLGGILETGRHHFRRDPGGHTPASAAGRCGPSFASKLQRRQGRTISTRPEHVDPRRPDGRMSGPDQETAYAPAEPKGTDETDAARRRPNRGDDWSVKPITWG